jgi:hypothetical protein
LDLGWRLELVYHDVKIKLGEESVLGESTFLLQLVLLIVVLLLVFDVHFGCLLIYYNFYDSKI